MAFAEKEATMTANFLKDKILNLPESPGVYIFKDRQRQIIYIGKAKSLKKRVQSYFNRFLCAKTQALTAKIADVEYIITNSEAQAELLEASLIKGRQPYYNISLKDDKSFPLIKISNEEFPVVSICRREKSGGDANSMYSGPYTDASSLRQALKVIRRIFGFRSCKIMPKESCLYFRLKLCPAPCIGNINQKEYKQIINQIVMFLESRYEELLNELAKKMKESANLRRFEEAAKIRDQINALSVFEEGKAHKINLNELEDLKNLLRLKKMPERIEGFDVSNIFGKEATGAMVSFYKGLPDKNRYRRFRIKTLTQIDDYGMIREVVARRYSRLKEKNLPLPDLILIDGGRQHLLAAQAEIIKLGLKIPLASIAKEKENIYVEEKIYPIRLNSDTPALNLIRRVRDEAHRFAVAYHHILRRKKIIGPLWSP